MGDFDPELINELIRSRRSVKPSQFIPGQKIPDEVINQAISNATWAPTHARTEPWYFRIFTGEGLKQLAEFQSEHYASQAGDKYNEGKFLKLKTDPLLCSHIIAICMKRADGVKIPEVEEIEAVACAVQNIYLTITAYGYGGYWTTGGVTYMPAVKPFFNLGEKDQLLGFFLTGHIAVQPAAGTRKAIDLISDWVK